MAGRWSDPQPEGLKAVLAGEEGAEAVDVQGGGTARWPPSMASTAVGLQQTSTEVRGVGQWCGLHWQYPLMVSPVGPLQLPRGGSGSKESGASVESDLGLRASPLKRSRSAAALKTPRPAVLSHAELLGRIVRFLAGSGREARADLGRGALVCRAWRGAAWAEDVWRYIAGELFPCLRGRVVRGGSRAYVVGYGRALLERRVHAGPGARAWWVGLRLHFEVWDELDGLRVLSAEGPVGFDPGDDSLFVRPARDSEGDNDGDSDSRVVAARFSAASRGRDPTSGSLRFSSVPDYFRRAHEETPAGLPGGVHVRVTLRDAHSGRQAVLWSSGKAQPEALRVEDRGGGRYCIYPLQEFRPLLAPPWWAEEPLGGHLWFGLSAVEGDVGLPEEHQMFEAGGVCRFYFNTSDTRRISRFVWSLLAPR
jgi:hypothetical protein